MILRLLCLLLPLLCVATAAGQPMFHWPVEGTLKRDFFLVNYVDHDTATGVVRDHHCGAQTYDGHQGTDIVLRSFRQMDSGVRVLAAAPGRVIAVVDTAFDRNKVSVISRGFGNWIAIAHAGGIYTYYAHIRRSSALVNIGDSVEAGTPIALVGSAGNSTDPHLHFEVWNDSAVIDPFAGPCNPGSPSYWIDQPAYDTSFGVINHGLISSDSVLTLDDVREYPLSDYPNFNNRLITFWIQEYGIHAGDTSRIEWSLLSVLDSQQFEKQFEWDYVHTADSRYYYWWSYIPMPNNTGWTWRAQYFLNNVLVATDSFTIPALTDVAQQEPLAGTVVGYNASSRSVVLQSPKAAGLPVRLQIFDLAGNLVRTIRAETDSEGNARLQLDGQELAAGMYAARLKIGDHEFGTMLPVH